jgi:hypothetical protein
MLPTVVHTDVVAFDAVALTPALAHVLDGSAAITRRYAA